MTNATRRSQHQTVGAAVRTAAVCGAVGVAACICPAQDGVVWSTVISTDHNPGGDPGGAIDQPLAIRFDDSGDLYVLIQSIFPELDGMGLSGGTGRSFALAKLSGDGEELWRREYGEDHLRTYDLAAGFGWPDLALAIDPLGRPRRAGSDWVSYSPNTGHHMVATRNTWDPTTGDHVWVSDWHPQPGVKNAFENGFVLDDDGAIFVFGVSQYVRCCSSSYWPYAARIDADGDQVWLHSFEEESERGGARSGALAGDGHFITLATASNGNLRLTKYEGASGDLLWTAVHEVPDQSAGFNGRMVLDGDDNIIVTGPGYGQGNDRFARVFKFDGAGDLLWESAYSTGVEHPDGSLQWFGGHPSVLPDGSFIVSGHFYFADTGWDIVVRRYAPDGSVMWHERFDAGGGGLDVDEQLRVMIAGPDDGVIITGVVRDENDPDFAATGLALHYNADGDLLWEHRQEDADGADVFARGVAFAPNGDIIVGYRVADPDSDAADLLIVRYGEADDCPADLNGDGVVNTQDFALFLNLWAAGDPAADWNGDGVVDTADFTAFLNDWAAAFQNGGQCP